MKSVALYGFAPATREGIWNTKADEIWSVVWAYKYDLPRLDRIIEIHPVWMQAASKKPEYVKPREHWEWMKNNTSIPIYMLVDHPEIPMSVRYPIEKVMEFLPKSRQKKVFSSSFDFLMGLAVLEGFDRIEAYGFEMGSDTEYRYQREGAAYWIGYCDAKGIELVLPKETHLLRNKMYGYEGGSMIYRQDLERMKEVRLQQKVEAFARLSNLEGKLHEIVTQLSQTENGEKSALDMKLKEAQQAWDNQYRLCLVISGALQECEYLIKEIDLEEPSVDLIDPMKFIPLEE